MLVKSGPMGELLIIPETAYEQSLLFDGPWWDENLKPFLCECRPKPASTLQPGPHLDLRYETELLPEPHKSLTREEFLDDPKKWLEWVLWGNHLAILDNAGKTIVAELCTARTLNRDAEPFLKLPAERETS